MSKVPFYATMFAMLCESVAVETIDGKGNGPLHSPCAVIFFLTFEIVIVYMTLYLYRLRQWNSSVVSQLSFFLKAVLAIEITVVWIYCLYGALSGSKKVDFTVLVEWNSFFLDLAWLLSFAPEWGEIRLSLVSKDTTQ